MGASLLALAKSIYARDVFDITVRSHLQLRLFLYVKICNYSPCGVDSNYLPISVKITR